MALAALALASAGPVRAYFDVDPSNGWPPGWAYSGVDAAGIYKSYVYYGGGGSFQICARAYNGDGTGPYTDCGYANQSEPQARLLHCGGKGARFYLKNDDNAWHHMTDRFFTNQC